MDNTQSTAPQSQTPSTQTGTTSQQAFREAFSEMLVSSWNVLSATVWPLQLGVLTAIVGLIITTIGAIAALPNVPTINGVPGSVNTSSDVYVQKVNLYEMLNLSIIFLQLILTGMFVNLVRSIWRWGLKREQERVSATHTNPNKVRPLPFEVVFAVVLDILCIFVPLYIVYIGMKAAFMTKSYLLGELKLQFIQSPNDPMTRLLSSTVNVIVGHPWLFSGGAFLLLYAAFVARCWRRAKTARLIP